MFKRNIINLLINIISIKIYISSTSYTASDIASRMKDYLKKNSLKSYYMIIDPDNFLENIRLRMINKYHEILYNKYTNFITLVIIAKKLQEYPGSSFISELYSNIEPNKLQNLKSLVILITVDDNKIEIIATNEEIQGIFTERVRNRLLEKFYPDIKQDDWFSNILELLKRIDILYQQYKFNVNIEEL